MIVKILDVEKNSPAYKSKILAGEELVSINGNEIFDVLDFRFYQLEKRLLLKIISSDGKEREVKIKKGEYDEIGLVFETYLMDKQHSCKNKCIFCFVDQLPSGMRQSLYFKDDDSRLSFLFGNYVTLTNITEREIERIIKMHISPINVSVHTTNPDLRVKMMANPRAAEVLSILKRFSDAGIAINCQLVLCPEINDGQELKRSIRDLSSLAPSLESIALVPVGLTAHREKLYPLKPYTKERAREVIEIANSFGEEFLERFNTRLVYPSDEFFIKAELPLPDVSYYEDFGADAMIVAIKETNKKQAYSPWRYLQSILRAFQEAGVHSEAEAIACCNEHARRVNASRSRKGRQQEAPPSPDAYKLQPGDNPFA